MLARNTIAIFILLVVDTMLISLTAVTERCFECCMTLVNFYHSYLFIWYSTQGYLRYMSQELGKKHQVDLDFMETNGSIFFHFQWGQGCAWASPWSLWLSGSLGHYWTLLTLTSFSPLSGRTVSAQGLAPSHGLNCAVGMFISDLAFWMEPCPVYSPTSCPCLLEVPRKCLVTLVRGCWWDSLLWTVGSVPSSAPSGTATLPVRAWPVLGHLCSLFWSTHSIVLLPLLVQRISLCPVRNPQWEILSNHLERLKWTAGL